MLYRVSVYFFLWIKNNDFYSIDPLTDLQEYTRLPIISYLQKISIIIRSSIQFYIRPKFQNIKIVVHIIIIILFIFTY